MIHLLTALFCAFSTFAGQPDALPTPAELGFKTEVIRLQNGRAQLVVRDSKTSETTITTYALDGAVETIEDYAPGEMLVLRLTMRKDGVLREEFRPTYTWQLLSHLENHKAEIQNDDGVTRQFNAERLFSNDGYVGNRPQCLWDLKSPSDEELAKLVKDTSWLAKPSRACAPGYENLGANICADKKCALYPRGEKGLSGLRKDLLAGFSKGMTCLAKYPKHRAALRALVGILNEGLAKPVTVDCAAVIKEDQSLERNLMAVSKTCGDQQFPGMLVNMAGSSFYRTIFDEPMPSFDNAPGVLFHEALHWINNYHGEGFDLPYVAQACCFADGTNHSSHANEFQVQNSACEMLEEISPQDWYKRDYQGKFASLATDAGFPEQSVWSAWQSTYAPKPQRIAEQRDYRGVLKAAYHWSAQPGGRLRVIGYAIGKAAAGAAGKEDLEEVQKVRRTQASAEKFDYKEGTPVRVLADATSEALKQMLTGDSAATQDAVRKVRDLASTECGKLDKNDRVQFWLLGTYTADRLNWKWDMPKELKDYWSSGICTAK